MYQAGPCPPRRPKSVQPPSVFVTAPQGRTIEMRMRHFGRVQTLKENAVEAFVMLNVLPQFATSVAKLGRQYVLVSVRTGQRLDERGSLKVLGVRNNGASRFVSMHNRSDLWSFLPNRTDEFHLIFRPRRKRTSPLDELMPLPSFAPPLPRQYEIEIATQHLAPSQLAQNPPLLMLEHVKTMDV